MSEMVSVFLPPQYTVRIKVGKNPILQLSPHFNEVPCTLGKKSIGKVAFVTAIISEKREILITCQKSPPRQFQGEVLHIPTDALTPELIAAATPRRWLSSQMMTYTDVKHVQKLSSQALSSWQNQFHYHEEIATKNQAGLRKPQLGALYSILSHWTVAPEELGTVVMPTGSGKTETMLSLLVNASLERVLVIVPTNALREQIAQKFLTLGKLRAMGVIGNLAQNPVVGIVKHQFSNEAEVEQFCSACNVIVATMPVLGGCDEEIKRKLSELCTHLIIDEAHHVKAPTWERFRSYFHGKPILQFTATPFREDGKHLGGNLLYCYPLRKAQEEGYFKPIRFRSVYALTDPDREIAHVAIDQLNTDRQNGLDHLLMARVNTIERAHEVLKHYQELAPEHHPLCVHSQMSATELKSVLYKLRSRQIRIIVCVSMLGEGFDLPQLKIAALHDIHKSLAITLQFTGRFTRTLGQDEQPIGDATMIANRAFLDVQKQLRALYTEDPDWNFIIQELSEEATGEEKERSDFYRSFRSLPREVSLQSIEPKMSTVVYKTDCDQWNIAAIDQLFPEEERYTKEIAVSEDHHLLWFIKREVTPLQWGEVKDLENVHFDLYLVHWDNESGLLFINSSNNASLHEDLAKTIAGETAEIIRGESVYRALHNIKRMVATNLGLLDLVSRTRRFMMLMGSDTTEGLDAALSGNKTKTNLFGYGYEDGKPISIGCSLKGRIWSQLVAHDLRDWRLFCRQIGAKLTDETISTEEIFKNFVKPVLIQERPPLVPLAIEWPLAFFEYREDRISVTIDQETRLFLETELEIIDYTRDTPLRFRVVMGQAFAEYEAVFSKEGTNYRPLGKETIIRIGKREQPLSDWFRHYAPKIHFEQDTFMEHDLLFRINRTLPLFDPGKIDVWDWSGINLKKESQGVKKRKDTVQHHTIQKILNSGIPWDVVFDDDDSGEMADVVAMRMEDHGLIVHLYHCKFSVEPSPGSRVEDFYQVCGQSQKSLRWRVNSGLREIIPHLVHREQLRLSKGQSSRFEKGDFKMLEEIGRRIEVLKPEFHIFAVQPGLSCKAVSAPVLEQLAATSLYLQETFNINFRVIASE